MEKRGRERTANFKGILKRVSEVLVSEVLVSEVMVTKFKTQSFK